MSLQTNVWTFVETYYPKYHSCDEIADILDLEVELESLPKDSTKAKKLQNQYNVSLCRVYAKAIEAYQNGCDRDTITIKWSYKDIVEHATETGIAMTDDAARDILHKIHKNHDAIDGINWDVIDRYIHDHIHDH